MPRPLDFHTQKQCSVCLPCVGGGVTGGDGGGVRLDFVGDYRTIAFTVSIAYTPSVTSDDVTAPPTQGSHFSEHPTPYFSCWYTPPVTLCSVTAPSERGPRDCANRQPLRRFHPLRRPRLAGGACPRPYNAPPEVISKSRDFSSFERTY